LTFERTRDYATIREVLTSRGVYRHITDDFAPPQNEFQPNEDPRILYILARDAGELLGVFMLLPQGGVSYEVHVAMLPSAWGARAQRAAREVFPWLFARTGIQRFVAAIPATNRLAIAMAKQAGFTQWGVNRASLQRNGKLIDMVHFGLSRTE
jgi:RimJ/RimL family protein N-acetyltransferase